MIWQPEPRRLRQNGNAIASASRVTERGHTIAPGIEFAVAAGMRNLAVVVVLVGCGSSPEIPDDQKLHDLSTETADSVRIRYGGKQVPLAELAMVRESLGLPLTGVVDVDIDITAPRTRGAIDYSKAKGAIAVACANCQIGDDKTKLTLGPKGGFLGDGIEFSHVSIGSFDAKLAIDAGTLKLTAWKFDSPELDIEASLTMKLAPDFDASEVDGCIRFKPNKDLEKRDPKLHALLTITGASLGSDSMFHIKLEGPAGGVRRLAKECK